MPVPSPIDDRTPAKNQATQAKGRTRSAMLATTIVAEAGFRWVVNKDRFAYERLRPSVS